MENITWDTSDFYSAVLIRATGYPLSHLTKSGKFVIFHFLANPESCEEVLRKHWDRSLHLETRLLIETIKELKTRIYEKMKGI